MSAIFISHSSADNVVANKLVEQLEQQGHHSVFLDFDPENGIPAGTNWEQVLYAKLRSCRAVIVLCSPHSMASKWCFAEITHARSLGKSLFPIIVAPCDLQSVFSDTQVLDLSDENNYQRLWRGLKEAGLEDVFDWDGKRDPYPGLNAFQEHDAALFFGRSEEIHKSIDLVKKIRRSGAERLLLFLGASGSGKSSLVRAGLIPRLKKDRDNWVVVDPFRCNEMLADPFFNLASVISAAFKRYGALQEINDIHKQLLTTHQSSHPLLQQACSLAIASDKRAASVLIFIDQFEELLSTGSNTSNKEQLFLEWLGDAINQAQKIPSCPLIIVATLRSDFFVDLQRSSALQNVDYAEFSVKAIPKSGLGELIEGPAKLVGLELEAGLVPQIIEDIESQNALPLLAFTLAELWKRYGQDGDMTLSEYKQLGGVRGSVKKAADDAFPEEQLNSQQESDLRRAFLAMVQVGEANQYRRKKAERNELPKAALPMLEKLVETRLLVKSETGSTYEVAHESLFQEWGLLHKWLTENQEFLGWRRRFQADLHKWEDLKHDKGALLRGVSLAEAEGWFKDHQLDLSEKEQSFFKESTGLRDREEQEHQEQQHREQQAQEEKVLQAEALIKAEKKTVRNFKWFTGIALMLLLIASVIAWYAFEQQQKTEKQRIIAEQNSLEAKQQANRAKLQVLETNYNIAKVFEEKAGKELFAQAQDNDGKHRNVQKSWLYTTAALSQHIAVNKQVMTFQSANQLFNPNIIQKLFTQRWVSPSMNMRFHNSAGIFFSPDGTMLVSSSSDNTVGLWDVASGKQIKQFIGHTDLVSSVAFNPDGKTLVSSSYDNTIRLWDVASGKQINQFVGHTGFVSSIAFNPDGKTLISGSDDKTVRLWDVADGKQIQQFNGHTDGVTSIAFNSDGKFLVSGSKDKTLRLWNVLSGKEVNQLNGLYSGVNYVAFSPVGRTLAFGVGETSVNLWRVNASEKQFQQFNGHTGVVTSVAFSPDGKTLLSGSRDRSMRLWEITSGQQIKQFIGNADQISSVAFSPDGKTLVSGSPEAIRLWDVASAKPINGDFNLTYWVVAISPDGKYLASAASDNTLRLWNISSGKQIKQFVGHSGHKGLASGVYSVIFSPDGKTLASGSYDKTIRQWDVSSGKQIKQFNGHTEPVISIDFSPDGRTLVSGSRDKTIRLWDVSSGKQVKQFNGHTESVRSVAFSPDGKTLASGSFDKTMRRWDVVSGEQIQPSYEHSGIVKSIVFSPDGKTLVSNSENNPVRLWDVKSGKQIQQIKMNAPNSVSFSPDGRTLVSGSNNKMIRLWDVASGKKIQSLIGHTGAVNSVAFSPDGRTLASGSSDRTVRLWDVVIARQPISDMRSRSVAYSPDGKTLASGSRNNTIHLLDVFSGKQIKQFNGHTKPVISIDFSPDGKTLVSSQDKTIHLWDFSSGKQTQQFNGHTGFVSNIAFSPDGKLLVSVGRDKTVRLWNVNSGKQIKQFNGHTEPVNSVAFSPDGKLLVSGANDKTVRLWNIDNGKQVQQFNGHKDGVGSVAFSPDGKTLFSGSHEISQWNVSSGNLIKQFTGHTHHVSSIAFSLDGKFLISGSYDSTVRIWDTASGKLVQQFDHWPGWFENDWVLDLDISPDGKTLAFVTMDGLRFRDIRASILFPVDGKASEVLKNFSQAGEFLWQFQLNGLEVVHRARTFNIKPQDDYYFSYDKKFRPLLNPPKTNQTKFDQVLEWAIEQADNK